MSEYIKTALGLADCEDFLGEKGEDLSDRIMLLFIATRGVK